MVNFNQLGTHCSDPGVGRHSSTEGGFEPFDDARLKIYPLSIFFGLSWTIANVIIAILYLLALLLQPYRNALRPWKDLTLRRRSERIYQPVSDTVSRINVT